MPQHAARGGGSTSVAGPTEIGIASLERLPRDNEFEAFVALCGGLEVLRLSEEALRLHVVALREELAVARLQVTTRRSQVEVVARSVAHSNAVLPCELARGTGDPNVMFLFHVPITDIHRKATGHIRDAFTFPLERSKRS